MPVEAMFSHENQDKFSFLSMEQFAEVMGVSLNTVKSWKSNGKLRLKKDYIQIGRTVRILYGPELIENLLAVSEQLNTKETKNLSPRRKGKGISRINLD